MRDAFSLIWLALIGLFRSRASLQAEILTLRHQLNVLRRKSPQRLSFSNIDRLVFAGLYRLAPGMLDALAIVKPETVIRWHRAGFRAYWRWKSRPRSGRPKTRLEIRQLIREISLANPLWGAPRIHGELLKLGIDVGQTSVAKYMARGTRPPSQGWKTFLHNHAEPAAADHHAARLARYTGAVPGWMTASRASNLRRSPSGSTVTRRRSFPVLAITRCRCSRAS